MKLTMEHLNPESEPIPFAMDRVSFILSKADDLIHIARKDGGINIRPTHKKDLCSFGMDTPSDVSMLVGDMRDV